MSMGAYSDGGSSICLSTMLNLQQEFLKVGLFISLDNRNSIFSSSTSNVSFPCLTSIIAPVVARKGLPSRIGISVSSRISIITKCVGMTSCHILIWTSSIIPIGYLTSLSSSYIVILVGFIPPRPSFSYRVKGIKLSCDNALVKGMLMYKFFNTLTSFLKWSFILGFTNLWGIEIRGLYGGGGTFDSFSTTSFAEGVGSPFFPDGTNSLSVSFPSSILLELLLVLSHFVVLYRSHALLGWLEVAMETL